MINAIIRSEKGSKVWHDVRMLESAEFIHRNRDAFAQLLRPLQAARHRRHVLVDRHCTSLDVDLHLFVVQSLHVVELHVEQLHYHLIVGLKVLLDDWSLEKRAKNVDQLQTDHINSVILTSTLHLMPMCKTIRQGKTYQSCNHNQ